MQALALITDRDCYTRAANEDCFNGGPRTRTKYSYDAAGNTLGFTGESFNFNQRGRMSSVTTAAGTTSYTYNARGELIEKNGVGGTTLFVYDEVGHLLGEYSSTGALIQETVWMDDIPVATLRPNGSTVTIYYVHTDHLNAPRIVTQSSDNSARWVWGGGAPNQNPLGLGTFIYNLRFPGQYSQAETGLAYNYFRDYDAPTGRYIQSDPIGLRGGINTYTYVGDNPVSGSDPNGLEVRWSGSISSFGATVAFGGQLSKFKLESECKCGIKYKISGFASFLTIGAGAKAGALGEFLADAAASHSSTEFIDPWDECPNPEAANGVAWVSGINVVAGIGGTFLGKLNLGWLQGQAPLAEGPAYGFDISIQSGMGASAVTSVQKTGCCSK